MAPIQVHALQGVSLQVPAGVFAVVQGRSGAGKTTLLNLVGGLDEPTRGTVLLDGRDITRWSVDRRARLGLARTFQISMLFDELSVADNLSLGVQPRLGHSYRFWRRADRDPALTAPTRMLLEELALAPLAGQRAGSLAHGDRRRLELAMALAGQPKMLLLDEPMAGTGPESSRDVAHLLANLKGRITMLLVEHDMDVVFTIADSVSVMVAGRCIATGTPEAIRADPAVRRAYLGEDA